LIFSLWTAGTLGADDQTASQIRRFTPSTFPPLGLFWTTEPAWGQRRGRAGSDGPERGLWTAMSRDRRTGGPTRRPSPKPQWLVTALTGRYAGDRRMRRIAPI